MLLSLRPHPDTPADAIVSIAVEAAREGDAALALRFTVSGDIGRLIVPRWISRSRADELWKTTCLEAFVADGKGGYHEFNLSPSGQWAAYGFTGYREGMTSHAGVELRGLERSVGDDRLVLAATLGLHRLGLPADRAWRIGLSAVIEETDGAKSYWALAHAPGKPDFHHSDAFACDLEPA